MLLETVAPAPSMTMTLDEVKGLISNDVQSMFGETVTVAESGKWLDEFYQTTPRWNYGAQTGKFWQKVEEVADILRESDEWPFEPLEVSSKGDVLWDGHHRANAAILVEWNKPIPVRNFWF